MKTEYIPIILIFPLAFVFPLVVFTLSRILHPRKETTGAKFEPYECGIIPETDARHRYSIRFYIITMLFVIFDVETVFLLPWAIMFDRLALFGFIEMLIFIIILVVGYVYAWKTRALEWV